MSAEAVSEGELERRRRRALFRSWHRGMREMDLILGRFAERSLPHLTPAELDQYEALLDLPDNDLLGWITGERPTPPALAEGVFSDIKTFARSTTEP